MGSRQRLTNLNGSSRRNLHIGPFIDHQRKCPLAAKWAFEGLKQVADVVEDAIVGGEHELFRSS
jgi:hypothetical protein